ncbi:MAG: hypothetical protein LUE97_06575 [Oscillospiraceae bacterium]|nr:hypothetical protein [Oscillospiraceae bacterium]
MRKHLLPLLSALALLTCVVCVSASADSEEYTVSHETTIEADASSLAGNDELLESYVEQLFSADNGIALVSDYGSDYLSGISLDVYTALKSAVCDIASGEQASPVVTVSLTYSYAELDADSYNSAEQAFSDSLDSNLVITYLFYDCSYEMYWCDKTVGITIDTSFSGSGEQLTAEITFTFAIATGYMSEGGTEVDASKAAAAVKAAENAQDIAAKYDELSDYDKLTAYKDEICALVSYSTDYAAADYGDIWQLVWVFDGDETTNVVCEGYSKAFQYLCDLSCFDSAYCYTVSGALTGTTSSGGHMWNIVRLNGVSYMADITNSDSGMAGEDGELFMVCTDNALESSASGYSFSAGSKTITYAYDSTTLALYSANVTTLGSISGSSDDDNDDSGSYDEESAFEAIDIIISSVAAGTQSETDENSSYDESLDLNGDGLNDLLDILSILYSMEEKSASADE